MSSTTAHHPVVFPFSPSPVYAASYPRQRQAPFPSFQKPHESSVGFGATLYTGGLHTPPADDNMNMTYPNPVLSNAYDSHVALARQPLNALAHPTRSGVGLCDALTQFPRISQPQQQRQPQPPLQQQPQQHQQQQQPLYQQQIHAPSTLAPQPHSASSRHSTRPSTPTSICTNGHSEGTLSKADSTMVMHSLKLPSCISQNGGSLDEFAARVGSSHHNGNHAH